MLHLNGSSLVVWRPGSSSVNAWREADIFLGRIPFGFQIYLQSKRTEGLRGDIAVDQLEFLDCALPGELHLHGVTFALSCIYVKIEFTLSTQSLNNFTLYSVKFHLL